MAEGLQVMARVRGLSARRRARPLAAVGRHALVASLALVVLFAAIDAATGVAATFVVLTYLVPIALITWFGSRRVAFGIAALATLCTALIYVRDHPEVGRFAVGANAVGAFGMFVAFVAVLDALRRHVERERRKGRAAIEQLRHAERLNVIGVLAAGVAHELGTPLNVISGAAEMLVEQEPERARVDRLGGLILRQTEQMTAIIRHLLDFGRRNAAPVEDLEIDRVVASAAEMLAATARRARVDIVVSLGLTREHPVRAGARELEQVVSNLLLNGVQAMKDGGTLRVTTRLEHRGDTAYGAIVVEDEGSGIAPEHLPYIFDPFFTTKGIGEGTGLGLSVSYGIVDDWGGAIEVQSVPGAGATFIVLIPLAGAAAS